MKRLFVFLLTLILCASVAWGDIFFVGDDYLPITDGGNPEYWMLGNGSLTPLKGAAELGTGDYSCVSGLGYFDPDNIPAPLLKIGHCCRWGVVRRERENEPCAGREFLRSQVDHFGVPAVDVHRKRPEACPHRATDQ